MMIVTVYITGSDPQHVVKDLTTVVGSYAGDVRGEVSVDRPVVLIQATIETGNYVYIDEFDRYYWITDRNIVRTDLTELTLRSDPLMTFGRSSTSPLYGLPIYVTRTEQQAAEANSSCGWNAYIPDRTVQKTARTFTKVTVDPYIPKFEYPDSALSTERQYILGVIG